MLNTRDAVVLRKEDLPGGAGDVSVLRLRDGRVVIRRWASRGRVLNVVDRYEHAKGDTIEIRRLDAETAGRVVDDLLRGVPWSDAFVVGASNESSMPWERSAAEERYTSTGAKFFRHREAMESYRAGTGRTVISTHVSPEGACNLRCPFCSVTHRDTHSRIALPRVQRYISDLRSRGLKAVIFTGGGEPTLYPEFNELVQWTKSQGLSVALITNGTTADRVFSETWSCFSWIRVSINIFDGWRDRIRIPREHLAPDCVVGASHVYSVEHEASAEDVPLGRVDLLRQIAEVADHLGAKYVRVLPNCLLTQGRLVQEHRALQRDIAAFGDPRFFQQYKVHGAPRAEKCHQSHFRPYLSEEPWHGDGEPGSVYPCDSVVLNDALAHFAKSYQICKPEGVLDFLDEKTQMRFSPREDCSGCVFTGNVNQLDDWYQSGEGRFVDEPIVHEEFV